MVSGIQLVLWNSPAIFSVYENICEIKHHYYVERKTGVKIVFWHKAGNFTDRHCTDRHLVDRHFLEKIFLPTGTQTDFSPARQVIRRQLLAYI